MKTKWIMRTIIYLGLLLLLTSCWNSRELNDLAIVSAIGIDKVPDKEEYQVTFQVVNPSAMATNMGASTGQPPITIYTTNDKTIFGALRKTSKKATRQLFFAHTQLVVIGESMAKSGINDIFDIFERAHELRLNSSVLVSRGSDAGSILKTLLRLENLPALGIVKKTENTARVWGESRDVSVFELINNISGNGELVISGVKVIGDPEAGKKKTNLEETELETFITMSGLAIFKDGKLKYWMDGSEARGTLWVQNKLEETSINIDSDDEEAIAVNIMFSKTKIKVDIVDGLPVFHVNIKEEGSVNELKSIVDLSNREEMLKLEKELAKKTKAEVMKSLQTAQRMKSDIFNFGNELKRTNPKVWETVQKDWDTLFAKGELDVHVEAYIRSTGMRIKSYLSNTE
jgi:spore germination protein KC